MDNEKQLIEEMNKINLKLNMKPTPIQGNFLVTECDVDIKVDLDWINKCSLEKLTKRNSTFYVWFKSTEERTTIYFATKVPQDYFLTHKVSETIFATTFPDLCWIYSEGTTPENVGEVATQMREGKEYKTGDLSWHLPSKYLDDLIEMLHTVNPTFMSGLMQDAIVYGPYIKSTINFNQAQVEL
jgi:hypothetical protein